MYKKLILLIVLSNLVFADIATVNILKGTVDVLRHGKLIPLKKGSSLEVEDVISTREDSLIGIIFKEGTTLALDEKSTLIINKFVCNPNKKVYAFDLNLTKGKALYSLGKIGELVPESFVFTQPTFSGIRKHRH